MVGKVVQELPGVPKDVARAPDAWGVDFGLAVIDKLLDEATFFLPLNDELPRPFSAPVGDAWHDPVVSAVGKLLKNDGIAHAIKKCLFGSPTKDKEHVAETERENTAEGEKEESDTGDNEEHSEQGSYVDGGDSSSEGDLGSQDGRLSSRGSDMDCSEEDPSRDDDHDMISGGELEHKVRRVECTTPGTLSFTDLSRFGENTLPDALSFGGKSTKVHTVILHEEDSKLVKLLELLTHLNVGECLHPTPVIIAVRSLDSAIEETPAYESDDDCTPSFAEKVIELTKAWETNLGKESQRLDMRCPIYHTKLASNVYRDTTPEEGFSLDIPSADTFKEVQAMVIGFHDRETTCQMTISPRDPSRPWRQVNAGNLMVHGSDITTLVDSDTWKSGVDAEGRQRAKDRAAEAGRSTKGGGKSILRNTMSVEYYMSLLCRHHLQGTAVLSTWDPCGAEQAAACRLSRDSVCFLGLSIAVTVQTYEVDKILLLGLSNGRVHMQRVIADHNGGRKVSATLEQVSSGTEAVDESMSRRASAPGSLNVNTVAEGNATDTVTPPVISKATGAALASKGGKQRAERRRVVGKK